MQGEPFSGAGEGKTERGAPIAYRSVQVFCTRRVTPLCTQAPGESRTQERGSVVIGLVVDEQGVAGSVTVGSATDDVHGRALALVIRSLRFHPARVGSTPAPQRPRVTRSESSRHREDAPLLSASDHCRICPRTTALAGHSWVYPSRRFVSEFPGVCSPRDLRISWHSPARPEPSGAASETGAGMPP